jgi:creatinine amidohydrolase
MPPWPAIWSEAGGDDVPAGHADSFTTSVSLYGRPQSVRLDLIPRPSEQPDWTDPDLDFRRYSTTGTIGDARHSSAELGGRVWELGTAWLADEIAQTSRK